MKHKFSLALITGASSGIGEAMAHLLASKSIPLIISGRNQERLQAVKQKLEEKVPVQTVIADLNKPEDCMQVVDILHKQAPDLVINNAGAGVYGDVLTHTTEDMLKVLDLDARAAIEICIESARSLVSFKKPGVILNVSSVAAFHTFPSFAIYAASKACLNSFSEAFDEEVRDFGVRVLAACPGVVKTRFRKTAGGLQESKPASKLVMTPEFVANEMWEQIEKENPIKIINWRYSLLTFVRNLLPRRTGLKIVRRSIHARIPKRNIIKIF